MGTQQDQQKRVAIYARVSTDEQARDGNSLDSQVDRCRRLIALHKEDGWLESGTYEDPGFSGGKLNRPSLQDLLSDIRSGLVDIVVVLKLDRLTRSIRDFHVIWEILEDNNVALAAATQDINTTTSVGRLMINVLVSFSEFERELIKERSQLGTEAAISRDKLRPMGGAEPFGYKYIKEKQKYEIVESEAAHVRQIFRWHYDGVTNSEIVRRLNEQGVKSRKKKTKSGKTKGGNPFSPSTISYILSNPVYVGKLWYEHLGQKIVKPGEHEPILDREMRTKWELEQQGKQTHKIEGEDKETKVRRERNQYGLFFKGIIYHADSGQALTPKSSGKVRNASEPHLYYTESENSKIPGVEAASFPARKLEDVALAVFDTVSKDGTLVDMIIASDTSQSKHRITVLEREIKNSTGA